MSDVTFLGQLRDNAFTAAAAAVGLRQQSETCGPGEGMWCGLALI